MRAGSSMSLDPDLIGWTPADPYVPQSAASRTEEAVMRVLRAGCHAAASSGQSYNFWVARDFSRWLERAIFHEVETQGHDDDETCANARAMPEWFWTALVAEQERRRPGSMVPDFNAALD